MLSTLKPHVEQALKPLASLLRNVNPNVITLTGLIFPVLFFIFLVQEMYILALVAFIFNGLDMVDGLVARAQNKVTAFGGLLDSTVDRFADFTVLAAFGFAGLVSWEIILPVVLLTYLISYIRSRTELAANGTLVASVGFMERTERLLLVFAGLSLYAVAPGTLLGNFNILEIMFVLLGILSAITVGQRIAFAYKKLK